MRLVTVGSVAFDAIESPFGKTDKIVGGAGTFITLASSFFVKEQGIISVVGDDFPASTLENMKANGIDIQGIQIKAGEKTFFWSGRYHNDMNSRDTLVTELNVLEHFNPIVPQAFQGADYLMLGNLSPQVQRMVIERMEKRPKLIAMDTMNFWMDIALEELKKTMALVDVLVINDEDKPLVGMTCVAVRMPGLFPASTRPAPPIAPTVPDPPNLAPAATVTVSAVFSAPFTTNLPASTAVPPL